MSEELETTQPNEPLSTGGTQPSQPIKEDDTQPIKPVKKSRWKSILLSILVFILVIALGGFGGYSSAIAARKSAEKETVTQQLTDQFSYALVDIQFGRYDAARQRLQFIISHDPAYPGAAEKLTEVTILSNVPTPTATPTLTPTPDFSGAENAFQRAQQLILAQDWPAALEAVDTVRKLDQSYKTAQVDGMYYFALRNQGYDLITKQGNLEGGIYYLTLAERFGPLDNSSRGLRDGARQYVIGASFWELDWQQASNYFFEVSAGYPSLWDGTMTAAQRYYFASMRYGDELFALEQYCAAYEQYQIAAGISPLDGTSSNNSNKASAICFPPAEVATQPPVVIQSPVATTEPAATAAP